MDKMEEKTPNWMTYPPLLQFYRQVQTAGGELEPDPDFLADPKLGRYTSYQLEKLNLPQNILDFLTKVGMPDQFEDHRSPDEEKDDKRRVYTGFVFWISCIRVETIKRKKYLVIGERKALGRGCSIRNFGKPDQMDIWHKTEDSDYIVVELKTGTVWHWIPGYEDALDFVNSSLEQFLLSMSFWRAFYPGFAGKVAGYLEEHPDKTEVDYIFDHDEELYAPFWNVLKVLDLRAGKKTTDFWNFMTDLSLY